MESVCSNCSTALLEGARYCSGCGTLCSTAPATSNSTPNLKNDAHGQQEQQDFKLGSFLSSIPFLSWPGKAMHWLSGIPALHDSLKLDPLNPFIHYRIAERFDHLNRIRGGYRLFRAVATHGTSLLASFAVKKAVNVVDGAQEDPRIGFYRNAATLAVAHLRAQPRHDGLLLVLGASSAQLAGYLDSPQWFRRAERSFILLLARSRNRYILADAAFGLGGLYWLKTPKKSKALSDQYLRLSNDLCYSTSKTYERDCPSIWHINDSSASDRIGAAP
jgi:hypothetical protein